MTAQEIIDTLEEVKGFTLEGFAQNFDDFDPEEFDVDENYDVETEIKKAVGEYWQVISGRKADDPESVQYVWYFKDHDVLLSLGGYYNSWDNNQLDDEFVQVFPKVDLVVSYVDEVSAELDLDTISHVLADLETAHTRKKQ
jgi:hypothetical protein